MLTHLAVFETRCRHYEFLAKSCTQIGDGYDFFPSVRDGASIHRVFRAKMTNLVLVVVLVVPAKAPYCLTSAVSDEVRLPVFMSSIMEIAIDRESADIVYLVRCLLTQQAQYKEETGQTQ